MSEFKVINVSEIDAETIRSPARQKAMMAMQATKQFVDGDQEQFERLNARLLSVVGDTVPPTMTYQDVIFENGDATHTYVLSDDIKVARSEAQFYRTHHSIEASLEQSVSALAISALFKLTCNVSEARFIRPLGDTRAHFAEQRGMVTRYVQARNPAQLAVLGSVPQSLMGRDLSRESTDAAEHIKVAADTVIRLFKGLNPAHFSAFRPYFVGINGYPGRYPGASGLYTAAIPILDLLVHAGSNIPDLERDRIGHSLDNGLYPSGKGKIVGTHLLQSLLSLESASLDMDVAQKEVVVEQLNRFRSAHMAIVKKNIPGAMDGYTEGSGGVTDVKGYLMSKKIQRPNQ
jgi:hypothetical protein